MIFVETKSKKFYFQEIDWIISFPNDGNEGRKYLFYSVKFIDRKNNKFKSKAVLADLVDNPRFEYSYPHTVGFFRGPVDEMGNFEAIFLELRIVRCIEEFWKFLNDLNI
jgi:hypothetical protein